MKTNLREALKNRRSYYAIENKSPITDSEIENIIEFAMLNTPSAFNSQSTRIVLLLGKHHEVLWQIVKNTLQEITAEKVFPKTKEKIDTCFLSGYGTILFFEDQNIISGFQKSFPTYKENFPIWSQHTSGMHQLIVWTMLEEMGFGASLQHYNPLIDEAVKEQWSLPNSWELIAQMPFGTPLQNPGIKEISPLFGRIKIFNQ